MLSPSNVSIIGLAQYFKIAAYALGAWLAWWMLVKQSWMDTLLGIAHADSRSRTVRLVVWSIAVVGLVGSIVWLPNAVRSLWWVLSSGFSGIAEYTVAGHWRDSATELAKNLGILLLMYAPAVLVVFVAWRRLKWRQLERAIGRPMPAWLRVTAVLVAVPLCLWPVQFVFNGLSIWGWVSSAFAAGTDLSALPLLERLGALWSGPDGREQLLSMAVFPIAHMVILAYALMVARGIVGWFEDAHRRFFEGDERLSDLTVVLGLTGILATGPLFLLGVFQTVYRYASIVAAGPTRSTLGGDIVGWGFEPHLSAWDVVWQALPLAAIPVAIWLVRAVDWQLVEKRIEWFPSGREERLIMLAVAAFLAWPLDAVTTLVDKISPLPRPTPMVGLVIVVAVIIAAAVIDNVRRNR